MKSKAYFVWIYAIFILIGGVIGFVKANSMASLIMGLVSAFILSGTGYGVYKGKQIAYDMTLAFVTLLFLFFSYRLALTMVFMPAGLMSIISLALLIFLGMNRK